MNETKIIQEIIIAGKMIFLKLKKNGIFWPSLGFNKNWGNLLQPGKLSKIRRQNHAIMILTSQEDINNTALHLSSRVSISSTIQTNPFEIRCPISILKKVPFCDL